MTEKEWKRFLSIRICWVGDIEDEYDAPKEEDIQAAIKEAEAHAEEDKKHKELVETKNQGDNLVYGLEKLLKESEKNSAIKSKMVGVLATLIKVPEKYETAMKAAREIIDSVVDADSALAAGKAVKGIPHCLTSEKESKAMLARKIKEMGLKWDKEAGQYVSAD